MFLLIFFYHSCVLRMKTLNVLNVVYYYKCIVNWNLFCNNNNNKKKKFRPLGGLHYRDRQWHITKGVRMSIGAPFENG